MQLEPFDCIRDPRMLAPPSASCCGEFAVKELSTSQAPISSSPSSTSESLSTPSGLYLLLYIAASAASFPYNCLSWRGKERNVILRLGSMKGFAAEPVALVVGSTDCV